MRPGADRSTKKNTVVIVRSLLPAGRFNIIRLNLHYYKRIFTLFRVYITFIQYLSVLSVGEHCERGVAILDAKMS